jgi:hypothetical protein
MTRNPRRLSLRRETVRRLGSGELEQVAGGYVVCCTYERSGCRAPQNSGQCTHTGPGDC